MKFLCRNCKAKYQIADEKVAGRTLRMTCQQCGEPIVVRGNSRNQAASRPLTPGVVGGPPPPPASALGASFARQLSEPARDMAAAPHEEWHVAINDVPVGPMRREEVARKVAMGAIARESLAWREGMDDWLPIKHIAELSMMFGSAPAGMAASHTSPPSATGLTPVAPGPATRGDMAPIGGRQMVAIEEYVPSSTESELPEMTVATVGALPTEPSAPVRQLGWGPMFALVSGGAFILALGALLGVRVLAPPAAPAAPVAAAPAAAATSDNAGAPRAPASETAAAPNSVIELDMQAIDGTSTTAARRAGGSAAAAAPGAVDKKAKSNLTDEQKEMLARMGGGLNQGGPSIRAPGESSRGASQGAQLTAAQLSAVVLNGRKNLQRCYETALRGANSNETVRLDVDIQVSPAGNVTSVHTSGKGLPGMDDCLTRTVRMWRFPMSGETTQTRFPVVFQPGA
jgi:hypothetical protein